VSSRLREYKIGKIYRSEKDDDERGYEVGAFRVTDEVKLNLRKPMMSLGVLLIEGWESHGNQIT